MKNSKNFIKNSIRSFGLCYGFSKWTTVLLVLFTLATCLLPIYQSKVLGDIVNSVVLTIENNSGRNIIINFIFLYALVWSISQVFTALAFYVGKVWTYSSGQGFEILFMKKGAEIDLGHYENPVFQNLMTRALRRGAWPIFELTESQIKTIGGISIFLLTSVITTSISFYIYLLIIITSIPMFIVSVKYGRNMWFIWAENSQRQRKYQHLKDHIMDRGNIIQTKILQASNSIIRMSEEILSAFKKDQVKVDRKNLILSIVSSIIGAMGVGLSFYLVIIKVSDGKETVGSMVFMVGVITQLVSSISSILSGFSAQLEQNLYINDLFEVLDTEPFLESTEEVDSLDLKESPHIEFRNVWFKYEGSDKWILKNINFTIDSGEKIALIGRNGAGKTTIIKLLSRIYDPVAGQILINGIDLKSINQKEWGSYLAVLLQDYAPYNFTISESIAMGRSDKTMDKDKIKRSTILTDSFDFINKFDFGFDQQLGREFDKGVNLSKGENQKIALSMTLYRDGLFTILDEPTASIDALSESSIFNQMAEALNGKSLIVITHRFNTTQNLRIIVVENGEIVESGSHSTLYKNGGLYKSMFDAQASAFRSEEDLS